MQEYADKFIHYENERDVLFILGAGASAADGALLQADILGKLFQTKDKNIASSEAIAEAKLFIETNFGISKGKYPTLESVFGYLDYFITRGESLGAGLDTNKLSKIRTTLIQAIHYAIGHTAENKSATYRRFWDKIYSENRNISVITMNYDTYLDEAFDCLFPHRAYMDYCLDFMNYRHLSELDAFNWWIDPRKPVPVWGDSTPLPIKVIKIHGSLNWKYCNCCNQVLLTPWNNNIDLSSMSFKTSVYRDILWDENAQTDLTCPIDGSQFETFILPPSHIKKLSHPALNTLVKEASCEIRTAKKIVFIGYSFPEADVHIKALIKQNITQNVELIVVNPMIDDETKRNYDCLANNVRYHKITFDEFITSDLKSILNHKKA